MAALLTYTTFQKICGGKPDKANVQSVIEGLKAYGDAAGLFKRHRLALYIGQLAHENGRFRYDQEVWGPTPAQKRYEDRADLGHSAAVPGEAYMFRGRTGIQNTGRHNYRKFTAWCRTNVAHLNPPDFEANPDAILTDPWEGLCPIWYWTAGNPTNKTLNRYADRNDVENLTKRINGGLNGFADRLTLTGRALLVLAGYGTSKAQIEKAQRDLRLELVDGDCGPMTRQALFDHLKAAPVAAAVAEEMSAADSQEEPARLPRPRPNQGEGLPDPSMLPPREEPQEDESPRPDWDSPRPPFGAPGASQALGKVVPEGPLPLSFSTKAIQARLRELNYVLVGEVDGKPGEWWGDAIMLFRHYNGLPAQGGKSARELDAEALLVLMSAEAKPRPIGESRRNASTKELRRRGGPFFALTSRIRKLLALVGLGGPVAAAGGALNDSVDGLGAAEEPVASPDSLSDIDVSIEPGQVREWLEVLQSVPEGMLSYWPLIAGTLVLAGVAVLFLNRADEHEAQGYREARHV